MDDLVRRRDLVDALARSSDTWANSVQGIRAWWPHAVKIKDNILREIERVPAVAAPMPCMIGDSFWCLVGCDCSSVAAMTVESIYMNRHGCFIGLSDGRTFREVSEDEFGKIAFQTREEAEAALADCTRIVDELLAEAAERCDKLNQECSGRFFDPFDDGLSGLIEEV